MWYDVTTGFPAPPRPYDASHDGPHHRRVRAIRHCIMSLAGGGWGGVRARGAQCGQVAGHRPAGYADGRRFAAPAGPAQGAEWGRHRGVLRPCAPHRRHIGRGTGQVRHFVLLGSTRKFTRWPDAHGLGVLAGEAAFRKSSRFGVMLHPTMIYGAEGEDNVQRLVRLLKRLPFVPLPGGGKALVRPIYQGDVTRSIRAAIDTVWYRPETPRPGRGRARDLRRLRAARRPGRRVAAPADRDAARFAAAPGGRRSRAWCPACRRSAGRRYSGCWRIRVGASTPCAASWGLCRSGWRRVWRARLPVRLSTWRQIRHETLGNRIFKRGVTNSRNARSFSGRYPPEGRTRLSGSDCRLKSGKTETRVPSWKAVATW